MQNLEHRCQLRFKKVDLPDTSILSWTTTPSAKSVCCTDLIPSDSLTNFAEDDSPYPEVRSAVANFDDSTMPVSTLRAWVMGIIWAIILSGMNQFFYFRYPSVAIGGVSSSSLSPILIEIDSCAAGGTIGGIPLRPCLGTNFPCNNNIRYPYQSRSFHDKGTCKFENYMFTVIWSGHPGFGYYHGQRRCTVRVRGSSICPVFYSRVTESATLDGYSCGAESILSTTLWLWV
jgi:OPT oligopeptide transporter protein